MADILKGILGNLMKHRSASLPQIAKDVIVGHNVTAIKGELASILKDMGSGRRFDDVLKDMNVTTDVGKVDKVGGNKIEATLALVLKFGTSSIYRPWGGSHFRSRGSYRPGGRPAYHPHIPSSHGIDSRTRDQVAGILRGILDNLTKRRAASLTSVVRQVAKSNMLQGEGAEDLWTALRSVSAGGNITEAVFSAPSLSGESRSELQKVLASLLAQSSVAGREASGRRTAKLVTPPRPLEGDMSAEQVLRAVGAIGNDKTAGATLVAFVEPPPCTFSEGLSQALNALPEVVAGEPVSVVLVNASQVFVDGVVEAAPTLYFVSSDQREVSLYDGDFKADAIADFVANPKRIGRRTPQEIAEERFKASRKRLEAKKNATAVAGINRTSLMARLDEPRPAKHLFLAFYAPWCPHCKTFVSERGSIIDQVNWKVQHEGLGQSMELFDFDITQAGRQDELVERGFDVKSVPTVFLVRREDPAHPVRFSGYHNSRALLRWARETAGL